MTKDNAKSLLTTLYTELCVLTNQIESVTKAYQEKQETKI